MRWIELEVFLAGEPNPYPPQVPAVPRRLRARPLDPSPLRTWLGPSVNGIRAWRRVYDAHHESLVGWVWVRRSTLRRRRLAWALWALAAVAGVAAAVWAAGAGRPDPAPTFAVALVVLLLAGLLLLATRVRAVLDAEQGRVGVHG